MKQTGGSARNATECVATVQKGEEQVGSKGSCATREMIYNRPLGGVNGVKKGVLSDISNIYHYQYFCRYVSVVKEGWTCKGASGVKGGVFKKSQRDFLLTLFNNNITGTQKLGRGTLT